MFIDWKNNNYNSILVIVDQLTKMVYYKLVKIIINTSSLAKMIIDLIIQHYGFLNLIIRDQELVFMSKFCSLLY